MSVNLTLTYQGKISTTSLAKQKFLYRRSFREQLMNYQQHMIEDGAPPFCRFLPENQKVVGPFIFCPLVTKASKKVVDLDIVLLSYCEPGCMKPHPTGDLDNYLKSLIDGLRIAQNMNEVRAETPKKGEDPFYCLLEDDQQVQRINITHKRNYAEPAKKSKGRGNDIFALIEVKIYEKYCG